MDLHDVRLGDYLIREDRLDGRLIGEIVHIRARVSYINAGYPFREWVDVSTATTFPYRTGDPEAPRLMKATDEDIRIYGLQDRSRRTPAWFSGPPC
ncbi:hypothetical protein [Sphingobium sp. DN12]|uniref:hypothetical protein n=1 Tax=Sphingobium sp. DN12 TaxID=3378073 RepID=UPI003DA62FFE